MVDKMDKSLATKIVVGVVAWGNVDTNHISRAELLGRIAGDTDATSKCIDQLVELKILSENNNNLTPNSTAREIVKSNQGNEFFSIHEFLFRDHRRASAPKLAINNKPTSNKQEGIGQIVSVLQQLQEHLLDVSGNDSGQNSNKIILELKKSDIEIISMAIDLNISMLKNGKSKKTIFEMFGITLQLLNEFNNILTSLSSTVENTTDIAKKLAKLTVAIGATIAAIKLFILH